MNPKSGASILEATLALLIISAGMFFAVARYLDESERTDGARESQKNTQILNASITLHPLNSMLKPKLHSMTQAELDKRTATVHNEGFGAISDEQIKLLISSHYTNSINNSKYPIKVTTNAQRISISSTLRSKSRCAGFISNLSSTDWDTVSINGSTLQLKGSTTAQRSALCATAPESGSFDYSLSFCMETPTLLCN